MRRFEMLPDPDLCPECHEMIGDDVFCQHCGAALDEGEASAYEDALERRADEIREEERYGGA
jgi:transcription initiation factor IIE alpha subunit